MWVYLNGVNNTMESTRIKEILFGEYSRFGVGIFFRFILIDLQNLFAANLQRKQLVIFWLRFDLIQQY